MLSKTRKNKTKNKIVTGKINLKIASAIEILSINIKTGMIESDVIIYKSN